MSLARVPRCAATGAGTVPRAAPQGPEEKQSKGCCTEQELNYKRMSAPGRSRSAPLFEAGKPPGYKTLDRDSSTPAARGVKRNNGIVATLQDLHVQSSQ